MASLYFTEEHQLFRQTVEDFMHKEINPNIEKWEENKRIPKDAWRKMGSQGYLGINIPEELGGTGADFFFSVVFLECLASAGSGGFAAAVSVHEYMAIAHILKAGSRELQQKYIPKAVAGEWIGALAITEPGGGSDVSAIRTRAIDHGDHFIIHGSKTFITNGVFSDFITTAVVTNPDQGIDGISLVVIDRNADGVQAHPLEKMGWHCSDTAELSFQEVRVPKENLIGEAGKGFYYIMESFQLERLVAAITPVRGCELILESAIRYMKERNTFGKPLTRYQVLRHKMAQLSSEVASLKQFVYHTCYLYDQGEMAVKECSMAKMLATELSKKVADECLQIYGGYGYMKDFPIERVCRDARVGTIVGGTTEIMLEIISKMVIDEVAYESAYNQKSSSAPSKTAKDIIYSLQDRFRQDKANGYAVNFHFDISGEDGGLFTVNIDNGKCAVLEGIHGKEDCKIRVKDKNYVKLESGQLNPQMALMTGKVKVSNISAMMEFSKMFERLK